MDKQVVFKTSAFGGFEKKAVLDYIYRLNEEASTVQTNLREQVQNANAARDAAGEGLAQANDQISRLKKDMEGGKGDVARERARVAELSAQNEALQDELTRVRERVAALQRESERARMDREELSEQLARLQGKRDEVDKAAANVGKLLLDARSDADRVLANAGAEAANIAAQVRAEAESIRSGAQEEAQRLRGEAQREAEDMRARAADEALRTESEARREAEALVETARRKSDLLLMQADLAADDTAGRFSEFARQAEDIRAAVAGLLADYTGKSEELARMIDTAGRAFGKTKEAIRSAEPELFEEEPLLVAVHEEHTAEPEESPAGEAGEAQDCFFRAAADGR